MSPLHIAFVCADPGVPVFGTKGGSIHAQEILRGFLRIGCQVDLLAARLGGTPAPDLAQTRILPLPLIHGSDAAQRETALTAWNSVVASQLQKSGPYDLIYERHALFSHAAMEFAAHHRIPGVLEVNAPLVEEQAKHRGLIHREEAEAAARQAFTAASVLVGVSQEVAEYLRRSTNHPERIHVIPNGVDPSRFPSPPTTPIRSAHPFTIGFVGTLKSWHGLDVLADAFAIVRNRVPDAQLLIVGDGPERTTLEQRLSHLDAHHATTFTGAVPPQAIPALLESMDVAVAPYPALADFYFSPLKVYEYMAAQRPVVASHIGQLRSLIVDGTNGLFCQPGHAGSLAEQILRLHDDPGLRQQLGAAARATILGAHTWQHVVQHILRAAQLTPTATAQP
jgi:glycosyltransferase involved in cell wall biosynthesis